MVDISSYAPSLSAVGAARASTTQATKIATSYGERPSFRDDAVTASAAIRAMSSKVSRLNDVRALERVDGVLNVTLAATQAIVDVLTEMKTLAARLQDQSLSDDMRRTLTNQYSKLVPRIDELTEMASFGDRNLINPTAASAPGDMPLPDGQIILAKDLRKDGPIVGAVDPYTKAPQLGALMGAFDFETPNVTLSGTSGLVNMQHVVGGSSDGPYVDEKVIRSRSDEAIVLDRDIFGGANSNFRTEWLEKGNFGFTVSFKNKTLGIVARHGFNDQYLRFSANEDNTLTIKYDSSDLTTTFLKPIPINRDEWNQFGAYINDSGLTDIYVNHKLVGSVNFDKPSQPNTSNHELKLREGSLFDDLAVYGSSNAGWGENFIANVQDKAAAGIHKWETETPTASKWAETYAAVDASLQLALKTKTSFDGIARTAELKSQVQQRMVDAIDSATARLVNKDIDRLGALRAAGEVREQLAQAMMQTQTNTLFAQTSLFSNALGLFDAINIGGFRPVGLETAGTRNADLPLGFSQL